MTTVFSLGAFDSAVRERRGISLLLVALVLVTKTIEVNKTRGSPPGSYSFLSPKP